MTISGKIQRLIKCFVCMLVELPFISGPAAILWFWRWKKKNDVSERMRPFVLYIDKFIEFGATNISGILAAYKKRATVVTFNAGTILCSYFGCRKLWNKMLYYAACHIRPDLIHIGKVAAIDPQILNKIRNETGTIAVFFYGDFLVRGELEGRKSWVVELGRVADAVLIMQKDESVVNEFKELGIDVGFWWSGTNPEIFYPRRCAKEYEVSFFSQNMYKRKGHQERRELIKALTQEGIHTHLFGRGWDEWDYVKHTKYAHIHPFVNDVEFAEEISKSKITITYNGYSEHRAYMACSWRRVFNCLACGSLHLMLYFPGLEEVFVNKKHLVWFYTIPEAVELTKYYLAHPEEGESICEEGRREVVEHHTWDDRIGEIINIYKASGGKSYDSSF